MGSTENANQMHYLCVLLSNESDSRGAMTAQAFGDVSSDELVEAHAFHFGTLL